MNADGTGQRLLVSAPGHSDFQPTYSPDGGHIVFTHCLPNFERCAIWIMRSDGTQRHLVIPFLRTPTETNNFDPKVSPDGRRITFTRFGFHGITFQVSVARIDGTHAHPLTAPRLEAGQAGLVTGRQPHRVRQQFRPAAVQHLWHEGQRHRSHEAGHNAVADQQLRARILARRKPNRLLQRPAAPGPVLRGTLRHARRRLAPAPGGHRHPRRHRRRLGHRATGSSGIARHALASPRWRAGARHRSLCGRLPPTCPPAARRRRQPSSARLAALKERYDCGRRRSIELTSLSGLIPGGYCRAASAAASVRPRRPSLDKIRAT